MNYAPNNGHGTNLPRRQPAASAPVCPATAGFVDPLEAARRARIAVSGDVTASTGQEVHGDNFGGTVR